MFWTVYFAIAIVFFLAFISVAPGSDDLQRKYSKPYIFGWIILGSLFWWASVCWALWKVRKELF